MAETKEAFKTKALEAFKVVFLFYQPIPYEIPSQTLAYMDLCGYFKFALTFNVDMVIPVRLLVILQFRWFQIDCEKVSPYVLFFLKGTHSSPE
jgi:hypothetical protein